MSTDWTPFRLDLSLEDARPAAVRVPEGFYLVECEGCEAPAKNPTTGTIGTRFIWRILQGPDSNPNAGIGGRLRQFNTLYVPGKERNHFPLTATLVALDLQNVVQMFAQASQAQQMLETREAAAKVFERVSAQCRGKQAVADVRDRVGSSQPFSSIDALSPAVEWPNLRKAAAYTAPNGPVSYAARPTGPGAAPAQQAANDLFTDLDRQI
jgi:hypothetical protein